MNDSFLDRAYAERDGDGTIDLYDAWSATYEAEVAANGYVTPARCAEALAQFTEDLTAPVLDFGCGTGLSGLALRLAGFATIDGVDISAQMLEKAKAKGVYRSLTQVAPDDDLPDGSAAICAVGAIGTGAAPISALDKIMHALPQNGKFVFSFNDHALADTSNTGRLNEWLDCGAARLLFCEYGDHLPGMDLKSNVYVVEKA